MTSLDLFTWANFERYMAVTALVMAVAILLPVPNPRIRLRFLYLTLAVCLIAPFMFLQHDRRGIPAGSQVMTPMVLLLPGGVYPSPAASFLESLWNRTGVVPRLMLLIGLLRILWLCVGLVRLSLYRSRAEQILPLPDHLRTIHARQRVEAALYLSKEVNGPVMFGLISPAVLLPESFRQLDEAQQSAIVCHELVHVRRSDAVSVLGEEVLRSLLWFHPCLWWLLDQVQLCREQVVDAESIALTGDRETYLETLLVFAQRTSEPDLAPATAFLKKSHLLKRVKSIATQADLSGAVRRVYALALCTVMPCLLMLAIWKLPLQAAPQIVPDTPGVVVGTPFALQHRSPVEVPPNAGPGEVVVSVKLSDSGEVTDVRVVSGPADLRESVVRSVRSWHFVTGTPKTFEVAIRYDPQGASRAPDTPASVWVPGWERPITIRKIDVSALPEEMQKTLVARLPLKEGQTVSVTTAGELFTLAAPGDPRVVVGMHLDMGSVEFTYRLGGSSSPHPMLMPSPTASEFKVAAINLSSLEGPIQDQVRSRLSIAVGETSSLDDLKRRSLALREIDPKLTTTVVQMPAKEGEQLIALVITIDAPRAAPAAALNENTDVTISRVDASALPENLRQRVLDEFGFHSGDKLVGAAVRQKLMGLRSLDSHLDWAMMYNRGDDAKMSLAIRLSLTGIPPVEAFSVTVRPIFTVEPNYPPLARQARVQGTVRFSVIVAEDGTVRNLQLVAGHPLLVPAATEAAKQYRFPPSSTEAKTAVDVNFHISQ